MLLWPRLDRTRIRRVGENPMRIAEIIEHRTSQPFDVILAMLTRQAPTLNPGFEQSDRIDTDRPDAARVALRIVRSEKGDSIAIQDLIRA